MTVLRTAAEPARQAELANALHQLAVAHAQADDLPAAIAAGREAVTLRHALAAAGGATAHELAASLGNLSNMLIDAGHRDQVAPLWEGVRDTLPVGPINAPLAVFWARYQLTHGWSGPGLRLAAAIATDGSADPVTVAQAQALVRTHAERRPG